jgi:hypothetical protein
VTAARQQLLYKKAERMRSAFLGGAAAQSLNPDAFLPFPVPPFRQIHTAASTRCGKSKIPG